MLKLYTMEEQYMKIGNKKIGYQIERKKGLPIIFIHGATGSPSALKWLILPFKNQEFTLVLVDLGGHGLSFRTSNYKDLLIENHVKAIKRILKNEGFEKVILVGHCLGSMVATSFAALEKEKIARLVLISPGFGFPWFRFLEKSSLFKKVINLLIKITPSKGIFDASTLLSVNPESYRRVDQRLNYQRYLKTGDFYLPRIMADLKHMGLKTAFSQLRAILEWNGEKYFKMISVPTLIMAGKKDKIFPLKEALRIKNLIKDAKINLIEEANHVPVLNLPEKLALQIINFIKKNQ